MTNIVIDGIKIELEAAKIETDVDVKATRLTIVVTRLEEYLVIVNKAEQARRSAIVGDQSLRSLQHIE